MTVYLIWEHEDHEGSSLLGIYHKEETAIAEVFRLMKSRHGENAVFKQVSPTCWENYYISIEVEAYEVS